MPLFAIHRTLDPKATPHERELIVVRSVGWMDTPYRPTWRRTFAIQNDHRFETWCMYDGRTAEEVALWNRECSVPFDEVRPVEQWRRDSELSAGDGNSFCWAMGRLPEDREPQDFLPLLQEAPGDDGVRLLRLYWDADRRYLYSVIATPGPEATQRFLASAGLPQDDSSDVDQVRPTDFAALYENVGFTPYDGDD